MVRASSWWSRPWTLLFGLSVGLLLPATAAADKVSDAMAECRGKAEGDACAVAGRKGACVARSFERPSGMSKRWIECSPGAKPDRKKKERKIDAAGPVGVLPSVGSVEDEVEDAVDSPEAPAAGAVEPAVPPAEQGQDSPLRAEAAEAPVTESSELKAPAVGAPPAEGPPAEPAPKDDALAGASAESERGGCRTVQDASNLEPTLLGLLLVAWRRRKRN